MSHSVTIRAILRGTALAAAMVLTLWAFAAQAAESAVGKWDLVVSFQGQELPSELTISKNADGSLQGLISSMQGQVEVPAITFDNGTITFTAVADAQGQQMEFDFEGTIKGNTLTGTFSSGFGEMDAKGTRAGAAKAAGSAGGIVGEWDLTTESQMGTFERKMVINPDLTGKYIGDIGEFDVQNLKVDGSQVTFLVNLEFQGEELPLEFEGTLDGASLTGEFMMQGSPAADVEGKRTAAPAASAEAAAMVGSWDAAGQSQQGPFQHTIIINADLTGKYIAEAQQFDVENLSVDAGKVTFGMTVDLQGQEFPMEFEGAIDGETFKGEFLIQGTPVGQLTATKKGAASPTVTASPTAQPAAIVGSWDVTVEDFQAGTVEGKMVIDPDLTGKYVGGDGTEFEVDNLEVEGTEVTFEAVINAQGQQMRMEFQGSIDGDTLKGDVFAGGQLSAQVTAKRSSAATAAASAEPSAIVGSWDVAGQSPEGPFEAKMVVDPDLTGRLITDEGEVPIENVEAEGSEVTFEMTINAQGQEILLEFEGAIDGDSLDGDFLVQGMPVIQMTAKRTGAAAGADTGGSGTMVGSWDIEADSMVGPLKQKMVVASNGTVTFESDGVASDVTNLTLIGSKVTFGVEISGYALEFVGALDGLKLTGDYLMGGDSVATVTATNTPGDSAGGGGGGMGALAGEWNLEAETQVGPMAQKLAFAKDGSVTFESDGVPSDVTNLKVDGNSVTFSVTIIGYDLEFEGTLEGAGLNGEYLMGGSNVATVTGTRAGSASSASSSTSTPAPTASLKIADLKGSWKLLAESGMGPLDQYLVIAADGSTTFDSDDEEYDVTNLAMEGNTLTFNVTIGGYALEFEGKVQGPDLDEINGDYLMDGNNVATVEGEKVQ